MKILDAIREFEITVSGGFAIYFTMCVTYVTAMGLFEIGKFIIKMIDSFNGGR